jgi:hypothetical protein
MRPGETSAQGENRVRQRPGFVGANAEFAAGVGDALGVIAQRKSAGWGQVLKFATFCHRLLCARSGVVSPIECYGTSGPTDKVCDQTLSVS